LERQETGFLKKGKERDGITSKIKKPDRSTGRRGCSSIKIGCPRKKRLMTWCRKNHRNKRLLEHDRENKVPHGSGIMSKEGRRPDWRYRVNPVLKAPKTLNNNGEVEFGEGLDAVNRA